MKIGILTGGGDVPGLNPCIKSVVNRAIDEGHEMVGIRRGWAGLLNYNAADEASVKQHLLPLDKTIVRRIDRSGGTFLHSSRTNPSRVKTAEIPEFLRETDVKPNAEGFNDFTPQVLKNLEHLGVDVLVAIGGDDTLSYAYRLFTEGFPIVAAPKTMDNDVPGTDYCLGFSTAMTRCIGFINNMRSSVGSHERIGVVEFFGRNSGATSLNAGYLASVDRTIISEVPFDVEKLANLLVEDKKNNPSHYAMMTISEGATIIGGEIMESGEADAYGHRKLGGIGHYTADQIKKISGEAIMYQQIGYLMRSGPPDAMDLMVGFNFGNLVMDLINEKKFGRMVSIREGKYTHIAADLLSQGARNVDIDRLYDVDEYRPRIRNVNDLPMFLY